MSGLLVFFVVLALPAIYGVFIFNQLVALKHGVGKAWSNIDILLKQRHDEPPNWSKPASNTCSLNRKPWKK